jgi:single-strand DNA-binding protein
MLNNTIISGRLTKDPELKHVTEKQTPVLNFTLAVDRDPFDGNSEKKADFIPVVAWNGVARFISDNFGKGGALTVQGRIQSRAWDDPEGKKHYAVELVAEKAYFSGHSKRNDEAVAECETDDYSA